MFNNELRRKNLIKLSGFQVKSYATLENFWISLYLMIRLVIFEGTISFFSQVILWNMCFPCFMFDSYTFLPLVFQNLLVMISKIAGWEDGDGCLWMAAYNICFLFWWIIYIWMEQIWTARTWGFWGSPCSSQVRSPERQFYFSGELLVLLYILILIWERNREKCQEGEMTLTICSSMFLNFKIKTVC